MARLDDPNCRCDKEWWLVTFRLWRCFCSWNLSQTIMMNEVSSYWLEISGKISKRSWVRSRTCNCRAMSKVLNLLKVDQLSFAEFIDQDLAAECWLLAEKRQLCNWQGWRSWSWRRRSVRMISLQAVFSYLSSFDIWLEVDKQVRRRRISWRRRKNPTGFMRRVWLRPAVTSRQVVIIVILYIRQYPNS